MPAGDGSFTNSSVENAFAVLSLFATAPHGVTVTDVSRELALPLSTAHRVVTTLCDAEFLDREHAGGSFKPGVRLRELLIALYDRYPIRRRATSALRELADQSGMAAVLYVRFGQHCLRIAGAQDRHQIHRPLLIGEALAIDTSPCGRVMLAYDGGAEPEAKAIRASGRLLVSTHAMRSVVFPLLDPGGRAFAAIALEGSALEFAEPSGKRVDQWSRAVHALQLQCDAHPEWTAEPFRGADTSGLRLAEDHSRDVGSAS